MRRPAIIRRIGSAIRRRAGDRGRLLQVGALPYRVRPDGSLEVLLVTTRGTGRWLVPKGWPMTRKSHAEAAAREAYEEAGVRGRIGEEEIGRFDHDKTQALMRPIRCTIAVFPLAVERELTVWPERGERRRKWFGLEEAARTVRSRRLSRIILSIGEHRGVAPADQAGK